MVARLALVAIVVLLLLMVVLGSSIPEVVLMVQAQTLLMSLALRTMMSGGPFGLHSRHAQDPDDAVAVVTVLGDVIPAPRVLQRLRCFHHSVILAQKEVWVHCHADLKSSSGPRQVAYVVLDPFAVAAVVVVVAVAAAAASFACTAD